MQTQNAGYYDQKDHIERPRPSLIEGKDPYHNKGFYQEQECKAIGEQLKKQIPWQKKPRWTSGYNLPQDAYYYDEDARVKNPISVLESLAKKIEDTYECNVFTIWCNYFPDGGSHIEWHQDQYGYDNFTLSFGHPRRFVMRDQKTQAPVCDFPLSNGDLYFFSADADKKNEHCVPKMDNVKEERFSILLFVDYPYSKRDGYYYDLKTKSYLEE